MYDYCLSKEYKASLEDGGAGSEYADGGAGSEYAAAGAVSTHNDGGAGSEYDDGGPGYEYDQFEDLNYRDFEHLSNCAKTSCAPYRDMTERECEFYASHINAWHGSYDNFTYMGVADDPEMVHGCRADGQRQLGVPDKLVQSHLLQHQHGAAPHWRLRRKAGARLDFLSYDYRIC